MTESRWQAVDHYVEQALLEDDPILARTLRTSTENGLPPIAITPSQGKLLHLLARSIAAQRILEIGTLGGYSTIWLARALPADGRLVTLEFDPHHAEVAAANIAGAGLSELVEIRVGAALDTLPPLAEEGAPPFDLVFIDADKLHTPDYLLASLELSRPGAMIIADNVIRDGEILDAHSNDPDVLGARRLHELLAEEPRVSATTIQTVGAKGYDGFTLALVNPS